MPPSKELATRRSTLKRIGLTASTAAVGLSAITGGATARPADLRVTSTGDTSVSVAWDPQGATWSAVLWENAGSAAYEIVQGSSYEITGLDSGTTYEIRVATWNGSEWEWGSTVEATPGSGAATPTPTPTPTEEPTSGGSGSFVEQVERGIHDRVNEIRSDRGLDTLTYRTDLATVARDHSQYMATNEDVSHTQADGDTVTDRLSDDGISCRGYAENILSNPSADASASDAVRRCVDQWMGSAGHRENILRDWVTLSGVGVATNESGQLYATQLFGVDCT